MPLSDWQVTTGVTPVRNRDFVETEVSGTNTVTSKTLGPLTFSYDGTKPDLERAVRSFVLSADPTTTKRPFVAPGVLLDLSIPATTPPTPAEVARAAWFTKLELLEHRMRIVNDGAVTGARLTALNSSITTLRSELDTDFLAAYGTP